MSTATVHRDLPPAAEPVIPDLCVALVESVIEDLHQAGTLQEPRVIHDLRVLTKRLRAAWKLVKGIAREKRLRARRADLRHLSGLLSGPRDGDVLRELCATLAAREAEPSAAAMKRLGETIPRQGERFPVRPFEVVCRLEAERAAWRALRWDVAAEPMATLTRNLEHSRAAAFELTRRALPGDDPEVWHEWRKSIKQFRYQTAFVAGGEAGSGSDEARLAQELGSLLGKRNDFAVLSRHLESTDALSDSDRSLAREVIDRATAEIMAQCRCAGRRFLGQAPD